ncbi:MAG: hypothetical protein E6G17_12120 [Actinobacteria bacterium]|nr:MAG: hypothetical protein E6G17_12120 [Actinomycetota bacterium]
MVDASSPASVVEVAGAGTCFRNTPPRYTLYPWTPEPLSVEAVQLRLIWSQLLANALSPLGTDGALVSAFVVALAMFE